MGTRVKPSECPGSTHRILEEAQQTLNPRTTRMFKKTALSFSFRYLLNVSKLARVSPRLQLHQSICHCVYFPDRTQCYITPYELLPPCKLQKELPLHRRRYWARHLKG